MKRSYSAIALTAFALTTSAFADESNSQTHKVDTLSLPFGASATLSYDLTPGSGDIVFDYPYFNQIKNAQLSLALPSTVNETIPSIRATLLQIPYSQGPGYVQFGEAKSFEITLTCSRENNVTTCIGSAPAFETGSVYEHGGDHSGQLARLMIISGSDGILFNGAIAGSE